MVGLTQVLDAGSQPRKDTGSDSDADAPRGPADYRTFRASEFCQHMPMITHSIATSMMTFMGREAPVQIDTDKTLRNTQRLQQALETIQVLRTATRAIAMANVKILHEHILGLPKSPGRTIFTERKPYKVPGEDEHGSTLTLCDGPNASSSNVLRTI